MYFDIIKQIYVLLRWNERTNNNNNIYMGVIAVTCRKILVLLRVIDRLNEDARSNPFRLFYFVSLVFTHIVLVLLRHHNRLIVLYKVIVTSNNIKNNQILYWEFLQIQLQILLNNYILRYSLSSHKMRWFIYHLQNT